MFNIPFTGLLNTIMPLAVVLGIIDVVSGLFEDAIRGFPL
jgi:hypothetical protein